MEAVKTKKKSEFARQPFGDKVLLIICFAILGLFILAIIVPMIYIILASFVDPITLQNQGLTFDFSKWTLTAYERVMTNSQIWVGFGNALLYSVTSTVLSVVITLLAAYPMSRADFKGKGLYNLIFMITMFFGGGLIPTYLLISNLNMASSEIISTYVYKKGLIDGDYGFSTAVGLFNTVINVIMLISMNSLAKKINDGKGIY